jgi:hypothetical protein
MYEIKGLVATVGELLGIIESLTYDYEEAQIILDDIQKASVVVGKMESTLREKLEY